MNKLLFTFAALCFSTSSCKEREAQHRFPDINHVREGEKFVIKLPEDHRAGENWQLSGGFDTTVLESRNTVWHGNTKGIYFHFRAKREGKTTLYFVKRAYSDTVESTRYVIAIAKD